MTTALKTIALAGAALALAVAAGAPAWAHHSGAMYGSQEVTLKAVVKEFDWANPHIRILIVGDPGTPESGKTWQIDGTSTAHLIRSGWSKNSLKPGDHVEVTMNPVKSGAPIGGLQSVTILATGKVLRKAVF